MQTGANRRVCIGWRGVCLLQSLQPFSCSIDTQTRRRRRHLRVLCTGKPIYRKQHTRAYLFSVYEAATCRSALCASQRCFGTSVAAAAKVAAQPAGLEGETEIDASSFSLNEIDLALVDENPLPLDVTGTTSCAGALSETNSDAAMPGTVRDSTIKDALFGLKDMHTTPITHLEPTERVAHSMPLYDAWVKEILFVSTQWLMQIDEAAATPAVSTTTITTTAAAVLKPPPLGEASSIASPSEEADDCFVVSDMGDEDATGAGVSKAAAIPPSSPQLTGESTTTTAVPTLFYENIIGRSKVIRYLFLRFLKQQHLWADELNELLLLAACAVAAKANLAEREKEQLIAAVASPSPHVFASLANVILYTPISSQLLLDVLWRKKGAAESQSSSPSPPSSLMLDGPDGLWHSFVVANRQNTRLIRGGPHRPPYGFGEVIPSIVPADLERRRFPIMTEDLAESAKPPPPLVSEAMWMLMSEQEQNALLFSREGMQASDAALRKYRSGIFYVDDIDATADTDVAAAAEEAHTHGDEALEKSTQQQQEGQEKEDEDEEGEEEEEEENSPADRRAKRLLRAEERARHEEQQRLHAYNLDCFHLGVIEPAPELDEHVEHRSGTVSRVSLSSAGGGSEPLPRRRRRRSLQPADQYLANGLFLSAMSGVVEDLQLSQLWQAFARSDAGIVLDTHRSVMMRLEEHKHNVLREVATQTALLLLFFARDEVRAVTDPSRTYTTLWTLHGRLEETIALAAGIDLRTDTMGNDAHTLRATHWTADMNYEMLVPAAQLSYTCFACSHSPRNCTTVSNFVKGEQQHAASAAPPQRSLSTFSPSSSSFSRTALELYWALLASYPDARDSALIDLDVKTEFAALNPMQQAAICYPFPLNPSEESEVEIVHKSQQPHTTIQDTNRDEQKEATNKDTPAPRKRGRPRKTPVEDGDAEDAEDAGEAGTEPAASRRGRPRKTPVEDGDAVDAEDAGEAGTEPAASRRGRPRKTPVEDGDAEDAEDAGEAGTEPAAPKRDRPRKTPVEDGDAEDAGEAGTEPAAPRRGRPRKTPVEDGDAVDAEDAGEAGTEPAAPRRGRPRKTPVEDGDAVDAEDAGEAGTEPAAPRRGRPRKTPVEDGDAEDAEDAGEAGTEPAAPKRGRPRKVDSVEVITKAVRMPEIGELLDKLDYPMDEAEVAAVGGERLSSDDEFEMMEALKREAETVARPPAVSPVGVKGGTRQRRRMRTAVASMGKRAPVPTAEVETTKRKRGRPRKVQ